MTREEITLILHKHFKQGPLLFKSGTSKVLSMEYANVIYFKGTVGHDRWNAYQYDARILYLKVL